MENKYCRLQANHLLLKPDTIQYFPVPVADKLTTPGPQIVAPVATGVTGIVIIFYICIQCIRLTYTTCDYNSVIHE